MQEKIKKSVAYLLAYIAKKEKRNIKREARLFCEILGADFNCDNEEAMELLESIQGDIDIEKHLDTINEALYNDRLCKMHILDQLNHMIYSDKITKDDYEEFEYIKNRLCTTCDAKI
ncbi:MAG: hypothetical protein PHI79_02395 [Sulfurovaceae bacterium]|nr:hypothetical protein [Sulfurovaceae bacterium]MDD5548427.1 hypothetical protein [Sulfurovaceae bacterium]